MTDPISQEAELSCPRCGANASHCGCYIYRMPDLIRLTGLSRSTLYAMISQGEFPPGIHLTSRARGWRKPDIQHWLASRSLLC